MTKSEAVKAMLSGSKVTHRYFGTNEWMTMPSPNTIQFEDGVKVNFHEFYEIRPGPQWDDDYSIFK